MIYQDVYWTAAAVYGLAVMGFWLLLWRISTFLAWRPLRWWITWIYLCIVLTPWQGTEPEPYYAPAIIVAVFDFMDVGPQASLTIVMPMLQAMVIGTLVIVIAGILLRLRAMKHAADDSGHSPA